VEFLIEVFWALLMAGIPIGIFTLALVWWALRGGYSKETLDSRGLKREMQAMGKKNKKGKQENPVSEHPLQKKWARFGGGFYGIVAFFTYIVVEVLEIATMIMDFGGIMDFLRQLNPGVIISMLVDALTNFVSAMVWPVYWMSSIETNHKWIWFAVAYGGYWVGLNMAQSMFRRSKAPAA
jgi:hypothetical protein